MNLHIDEIILKHEYDLSCSNITIYTNIIFETDPKSTRNMIFIKLNGTQKHKKQTISPQTKIHTMNVNLLNWKWKKKTRLTII